MKLAFKFFELLTFTGFVVLANVTGSVNCEFTIAFFMYDALMKEKKFTNLAGLNAV